MRRGLKKLWTSFRLQGNKGSTSEEGLYHGSLVALYVNDEEDINKRQEVVKSKASKGLCGRDCTPPVIVITNLDDDDDDDEKDDDWWQKLEEKITLDEISFSSGQLERLIKRCSSSSSSSSGTLKEIHFLPKCQFPQEGQSALQALLCLPMPTKVTFEGFSWTFFQALEASLSMTTTTTTTTTTATTTSNITCLDLWLHESRQCAVISAILPKLTNLRLRGPDISGSGHGGDGIEFCSPGKIDWSKATQLQSLSLVSSNLELVQVLQGLPPPKQNSVQQLHTLDLSYSSIQLPEVWDALLDYLSRPDCGLKHLIYRHGSTCMSGDEVCRLLQASRSLEVLDLGGSCSLLSLSHLVQLAKLLEYNTKLQKLDISPPSEQQQDNVVAATGSVRSSNNQQQQQALYKPDEMEQAQDQIRTSLEKNLTLRWFLCKGLKLRNDLTFFGSGMRF